MADHTVAVAHHLDRIADRGYTIVENAIDTDLLDGLLEDLDRLELELGIEPCTNRFEGHRTWRIYNLLAHGERFRQIPVHPAVLPVVEGVLDRGCLVSSLSSIAIGPGERAQPLHADDQLIPLPKPHPAVVCNTMWALTEFTEANGATRVVPGSHRADHDPDPSSTIATEPTEMARGSVLVWHGSLWHGGGANRTDRRRVGIAMNYCAGYLRQQENQQLGLDRELVATFPRRLQELVGYGVYHGLIGHIDKRSPLEMLAPSTEHRMVWDA
ncbi:MAG: phytanoyl-CoA dioxygenase family protein [Acidimicrobiales bacterium]|jgi:ectoine hydroxylase-related dioxygenase (phytanoyl-CoA dioxygenase family)|nr:phytanoyl-CoA dioxygenase family protein [Acidimicrobiales bacterium]